MNRCGLCGLRKELIDNLCERCQEIERLMGECLSRFGESSNDCYNMSMQSSIQPFGVPCNLDRSWMNNLPITMYRTITSIISIEDSTVNTIPIIAHEYAFIASDELEADLGEMAIKVILNNIIKLIILDALGKHHSLLRIVAYDGSINTEGLPRINYPMLMALSYLNLDSQIQSLSLDKQIILAERVPWERLVTACEDQVWAAYYSRYGVGIRSYTL